MVVLDRRPAVARSGDDDVSAAGEETLKNFDTNGALPDAGEQRVLVLEGSTGRSDLVKDVEVDASEVAAVLPVCTDLALEVQEGNPICGNRRDSGDLGTKELRGRATTTRTSVTSARLWALAERTNHALVKGLDSALLLLADLRLRLDDIPELQNVFLDLLDVGWRDNGVRTCHLFDVGLELPDVFTDDLLVDDVTFVRNLGVGSSRERN